MIEEDLSAQVVNGCFSVYNDTGYGFLEIMYQRCLVIELRRRGMRVETEVPMTVKYQGTPVGDYRLDLVIERKIIVECKAGERLHLAHEMQLLNYLTATGLQVGYLFNFGPAPSFKRLVHERSQGRRSKLAMEWK